MSSVSGITNEILKKLDIIGPEIVYGVSLNIREDFVNYEYVPTGTIIHIDTAPLDDGSVYPDNFVIRYSLDNNTNFNYDNSYIYDDNEGIEIWRDSMILVGGRRILSIVAFMPDGTSIGSLSLICYKAPVEITYNYENDSYIKAGELLTISVNRSAVSGVPSFEIRYTTNGNYPSSSSPIYSSGIDVFGNTQENIVIVRAGLWYSGKKISDDFSITLNRKIIVVDGVILFSPLSGTQIGASEANIVTLTATSEANESFEVRYTLDGSTPSKTSILYAESGIDLSSVFENNNSASIKAIMYSGEDVISNIYTANYTKEVIPDKDYVIAFTPVSGTVFSPEGDAVIQLTATSGTNNNSAEIRYTLDGSAPTKQSTLYTSSGVDISEILTSDNPITIKALAFLGNYEVSNVATASYTRKAIPAKDVTLTITPASGTHFEYGETVKITVVSSNPDIDTLHISYSGSNEDGIHYVNKKYNGTAYIFNATLYNDNLPFNGFVNFIAYDSDGYPVSESYKVSYTQDTTPKANVTLTASGNSVNLSDPNPANFTITPSRSEGSLDDIEIFYGYSADNVTIPFPSAGLNVKDTVEAINAAGGNVSKNLTYWSATFYVTAKIDGYVVLSGDFSIEMLILHWTTALNTVGDFKAGSFKYDIIPLDSYLMLFGCIPDDEYTARGTIKKFNLSTAESVDSRSTPFGDFYLNPINTGDMLLCILYNFTPSSSVSRSRLGMVSLPFKYEGFSTTKSPEPDTNTELIYGPGLSYVEGDTVDYVYLSRKYSEELSAFIFCEVQLSKDRETATMSVLQEDSFGSKIIVVNNFYWKNPEINSNINMNNCKWFLFAWDGTIYGYCNHPFVGYKFIFSFIPPRDDEELNICEEVKNVVQIVDNSNVITGYVIFYGQSFTKHLDTPYRNLKNRVVLTNVNDDTGAQTVIKFSNCDFSETNGIMWVTTYPDRKLYKSTNGADWELVDVFIPSTVVQTKVCLVPQEDGNYTARLFCFE